MGEEGIREFVIPLEKDELMASRADVYSVEEIVPPGGLRQALDATRTALQQDGAAFILQHFDTFFSVLVHGNKLEFAVTMRAFERILKATNKLVEESEQAFDNVGEISLEERPRLLCITKMYAYLLSSLSCYHEDYVNKKISNDMDNMGKKKKTAKKSDAEVDWEPGRQKVLELIHRWLQLPLQKLWTPPIVEDLFTTILAQLCYKVLEQNKDIKQKQLRETIFQILGILVKRYNHGITCVVRIIQLVKLNDTLATPLATGVVQMVHESGCSGFIKEILREIAHSEPGEADARNISTFLETIASTRSDLILPILDSITEHLSSECYSMRNCVLGVLGNVVIGSLTAETIDEERREKRDECLAILEEHLLDNHAYVRSKVLQVWQRLCCQGAIPLAKQGAVFRAAVKRLEDKSANVRKQALQLLRALLQGNPFAAKLDKQQYTKQLEEAKVKLKQLKITVASQSTAGDAQRFEMWNALLPEIQRAVTQVFENEKDDDDTSSSSASDGEPEEAAEAPQIDRDAEFEKVRQLLLTEEVFEAVTYLKKICNTIPEIPDMKSMTRKQKEDCLFVFLLKIFGESQSSPTKQGESARDNTSGSQSTEPTPSNKEFAERKEELRKQRQLVQYIKNCLEFSQELEDSIPVAENMLFSTTVGDAVEACTFLGTACQFEMPRAMDSIRKALFQVCSRDQSVRNNVASVYKEIYLQSKEANQSERQKALTCVNGLIELLRGLKPGQSPAMGQLIGTWRTNEELGDNELQVMWEKFSLKIPATRPEDSRAALMLLTMVAASQSTLLTGNLEVLVKVGLGDRAKDDLLLARDTCRALLKIKQDPADAEKTPIRYPNDHAMFEGIMPLVLDKFTSTKDDGYISFVTDAINAIYHLADRPDELITRLLREIAERGHFFDGGIDEETEDGSQATQRSGLKFHLLARLFYIVGHIAIRQMVHLDNGVFKELKRRNVVREKKKDKGKTVNVPNPPGKPTSTPSLNGSRRHVETPASARQALRNKETNSSTATEDNGEEALEGAVADDGDAEFVTAALETEILSGDGILAKFVPLVLEVCRNPEKYHDEQLQVWAVLALSKMMTISSIFCIDSLQLLVTIMERSTDPRIRANVLIGLCDLTTRFPNQVEPWTSHIYGRLRDGNVKVRSTCVRMLSTLIMREMVRVKGQVSGLALSLIDPEPQIRVDTKEFFKDLSCKGNALYNVMPDIISRLTDTELNLEEDDFHEIIKYILGLLQKERQIDTIIDKLCSRFKLATSERQWRDLSYCLSLLQFNGKSIRRLIESLPLLKDKIHHKQVLKSLHTIIEVTKRKPDAKAACLELEEKIEQMMRADEAANGLIDDRVAMPPPPVPSQRKKKTKTKKRRDSSSEDETENDDEDDEDNDSDADNVPSQNVSARVTSLKKKNESASSNSKTLRRKHPTQRSDSDSDSDDEVNRTKSRPPARAGQKKNESASSNSKAVRPKHTTQLFDSDSDSYDEANETKLRTPARVTPSRSSTKRKKAPAASPAGTSPQKSKRTRQCLTPIASTSDAPTPRRTSSRVANSASKRR